MSLVLSTFGLLDFTMLRPVLAWRAFWNLWTVYIFNFQFFFSDRGIPRILNQWIRGNDCGVLLEIGNHWKENCGHIKVSPEIILYAYIILCSCECWRGRECIGVIISLLRKFVVVSVDIASMVACSVIPRHGTSQQRRSCIWVHGVTFIFGGAGGCVTPLRNSADKLRWRVPNSR
jgi:hypothetical protein